jgi:acyl-coenzyme A synthetase/AMP-(fatty) acid ligase
MNVANMLSRRAEEQPDSTALDIKNRQISFRNLDDAIWRAVEMFLSAGVKPGDIVAVGGAIPSELGIVTAYALARLGAVQMPMSKADPPAQRTALASRHNVRFQVCPTDAPLLESVTQFEPSARWFDRSVSVPQQRYPHPGGDTPWLLNHSSGTTAQPKAMLITHAMEIARASEQGHPDLSCRPGERFMSLIGLNFWVGRSRAMRALAEGATVVLRRRTRSVAENIEMLAAARLTHLVCTPSELHDLASLPQTSPKLPTLRTLRVISARLPPIVLKTAMERLSTRIYTNYGANETGNVTIATPEMLAAHPQTVGRPVAGAEIRLVDHDGAPVATGQLGHVRLRTSGMIAGYADDVQKSHRNFMDGWFEPGDLAMRDSCGLYYLRGRVDDVMNYDGMLVSCAEIEDVLMAHPAVADAAAFPVADLRYQDVPCAALVLQDEVPLQILLRHCQAQIGRRAPRLLFSVGALPRNPMGKILRRTLSEKAEEVLAARNASIASVKLAVTDES